MLMSYVIQSCNMRTIGLTFVSFYHEVLEHKGIDNWVNEKQKLYNSCKLSCKLISSSL